MTKAVPVWDRQVTVAFVLTSIMTALLISILSSVLFLSPSEWINPLAALGFPLSLAILPILSFFILYPVFISQTKFGRPTTRKAIIDQLAFAVFLIPGTMLTEVILVYISVYLWSVISPPFIGQAPSFLGAGWFFVILFPATVISMVIGIPAVLLCNALYDRAANKTHWPN